MPGEEKTQNKPIPTAKKIKKVRADIARAVKNRVEPTLPGGFRDYGPADAIVRSQMLETIRKTFEIFGFDPMETASIQRKEVLFGGEKESAKIVFEAKGSREKKSDTALRFDLTVPFARFMAANPEISKPFKRYQIGTVWRGESPQAGRYREFMQADIDIFGSSSMDADAEVIATIYRTLKNLGIENFVIKINSRKFLNSILGLIGIPQDKASAFFRLLDKREKIGNVEYKKEYEKLFNKRITEATRAVLGLDGEDKMRTLPGATVAYQELNKLREKLVAGGISEKFIEQDSSIARGFDYYTGVVFETFLTKAPEMGSIASGGRYDELIVPFTGKKIPAIGASIGIDRLFAAQEKLGLIKKQATVTKVLVLNVSARCSSDYTEMVKQLRDAGINTSLYLGDDTSFQAQFSYAVKKEIPFVVIFGEEEKKKNVVAVKNLTTRKQEEVAGSQLVEYFTK